MSHRMIKSKALDTLGVRIAGWRAADPKAELVPGQTLASVAAKQAELDGEMTAYNQTMAKADGQLVRISNLTVEVNEFSKRLLAGASSRWGDDSEQYKQMGGKPRRERKRRGEGKKAQAAKARKAAQAAAPVAAAKPAAPAFAGGDSAHP